MHLNRTHLLKVVIMAGVHYYNYFYKLRLFVTLKDFINVLVSRFIVFCVDLLLIVDCAKEQE